ncbi:hypothetical protein F66182_9943 [Fusarium sp. NRRL 66182]|nr:hypothetical protein F66182_9943 [Fusarium sp. NRRL 66182]
MTKNTNPWHLVKARAEHHFDSHQSYWYQTVGLVLEKLLDNAEYSFHSQVDALNQFANLVAPYLGPSLGTGQPQWESFMTDNQTPIELSWDFHTGYDQPTIRYSIEPVMLDAGTTSNPYNSRAAARFRHDAIKTFPDMDTTLFDHFQAYFERRWVLNRKRDHLSTVFWAFDLDESGTTNKAYIFPDAACDGGLSTLDIMFNAINTAPGCSLEALRAFGVFSDFVNHRPRLNLEIVLLALDLVPVSKSRLKIYFRDSRTNFNAVKEVMSLSGRLDSPEIERGLVNLKMLWDSLLDTQKMAGDSMLPHKDHKTAGILYNIEFRMSSTNPKVKIYIPVRHYAKNDLQVIRALKGFLTDQVSNKPDLAAEPVRVKRYSECMEDILYVMPTDQVVSDPDHHSGKKALSSGLGAHTYIGCSIQTGGDLRVVSYINPRP